MPADTIHRQGVGAVGNHSAGMVGQPAPEHGGCLETNAVTIIPVHIE
jgi:hypothetical protein